MKSALPTFHSLSTGQPGKGPSKKALVLFTSHPAKESLRKQLGNIDRCQEIYRAFLGHILKTIIASQEQNDFDIIIASEKSDLSNIEKVFATIDGADCFSFVQHSGNYFAQKFEHVLKTVFNSGYDQLAVIGNDCLDLTPEIISSTFANLTERDVVLGPANDGGFYLLGLKAFDPAIFKNVSWCSATVLGQISRNIENMEKSFCLLPCLMDIDCYSDLNKWLLTPNVHYKPLLHTILVSLLFPEIVRIFYHSPFLPHRHLNKQIWQKPPPKF